MNAFDTRRSVRDVDVLRHESTCHADRERLNVERWGGKRRRERGVVQAGERGTTGPRITVARQLQGATRRPARTDARLPPAPQIISASLAEDGARLSTTDCRLSTIPVPARAAAETARRR